MVRITHYDIVSQVRDRRPIADNFVGDTNLSPEDDTSNGDTWLFLSGVLKGVSRRISVYTGEPYRIFQFTGEGSAADTPFPEKPSNGDDFRIISL